MAEYVEYVHHDIDVWVRGDLKGKHRENCLCFACERFTPEDRDNSCLTANHLYSLCCLTGLTTPVYECPDFLPT